MEQSLLEKNGKHQVVSLHNEKVLANADFHVDVALIFPDLTNNSDALVLNSKTGKLIGTTPIASELKNGLVEAWSLRIIKNKEKAVLKKFGDCCPDSNAFMEYEVTLPPKFQPDEEESVGVEYLVHNTPKNKIKLYEKIAIKVIFSEVDKKARIQFGKSEQVPIPVSPKFAVFVNGNEDGWMGWIDKNEKLIGWTYSSMHYVYTVLNTQFAEQHHPKSLKDIIIPLSEAPANNKIFIDAFIKPKLTPEALDL